MSFWRTFGFHSVSAIDTLLEHSDVTLEQLLDEDDLLQETKSQNKKLIDFLCQPETLQKLIRYITTKTEHEDDPKLAIKYPFLSCEVLASEVWSIYEAISNDAKLMDMLYSIFEKEPPLDIQLSAYAARVAVLLLQKKVTETVSFLKQKKDIVEHFLLHLGNPAVMDLLLKLISCEDPSTGNSGALEWLQKTNLIKSLVEKFKSNSPDTHENVAHTLVEIIKIGPNAGPLIEQLESKSCLNEFMGYMLENKNGSELSYGVHILNALVARASKDQYNEQQTQDQLPESLSIILSHLDSLLKFLESPNAKQDKETEVNNNNTTEAPKTEETTKDGKSEKPEEPNPVKPGKEEVSATTPPSTSTISSSVSAVSALNFYGKKKLKCTVGEIEPVGFCRLKLVEFFSCLSRTNIQIVDKVLSEKGVFRKCIDLFFAHPWNNFLHTSVEAMIRGALESPNEDLKTHILADCKLLDKIIANHNLNNEVCSKPKGMRLGNMGHVTSLVFVISEMSQHSPAIGKLVTDHSEWGNYSKGIMEQSVNVSNSFGFSQAEETMENDPGQFVMHQGTSFTSFGSFSLNEFSSDNGEDDPNTGMDNNDFDPNYPNQQISVFGNYKEDDSDESEESDDEEGDAVVRAKLTEGNVEDEDDEIAENLQNTDFGQSKNKKNEGEHEDDQDEHSNNQQHEQQKQQQQVVGETEMKPAEESH